MCLGPESLDTASEARANTPFESPIGKSAMSWRPATAGCAAVATTARACSRSAGPQWTRMRACGTRSASQRASPASFSPPHARAVPLAELSLRTTSGDDCPWAGRPGNSVASAASAVASSAGVAASATSSGPGGTPSAATTSIKARGGGTMVTRPRSSRCGGTASVRSQRRQWPAAPTRRRPPPRQASVAEESELGRTTAASGRAARMPRTAAANDVAGSRRCRS